MNDWTQTLGATPLLLIAAGSIIAILVLIIRYKMHAFLALIIVSALTALAARVPTDAIMDTLLDGFGTTLAAVALLVGLGAMLGRIIEYSGGASVLARQFVDIFGEKRAPFALGIASLILGFPIFFDAGLIVMLPIVFAIARRISSGNVLLFGLPAAAAFSVMHVFLPPHPGPVAAAEFFNANVGLILIVGLVLIFPVWYLSGYVWGKLASSRVKIPVPSLFGDSKNENEPDNPPRTSTVLWLLLIPMLLIFLNTGLTTLGTSGYVNTHNKLIQVLIFIGNSPIALLIAVLVAAWVLGSKRRVDGTVLEKVLDSALGPVCSVILITGAGGMFGGVLRATGIGDALSDVLANLGMPVIFAAYIIAVMMRLAQGSATVALVTAAGLASPAVAAGHFNELQIVAITLATAAGSVFAGHVNDSGFWLVGRLMDMDVKTTLKTWTVQQTIESLVAFAIILMVYALASMF